MAGSPQWRFFIPLPIRSLPGAIRRRLLAGGFCIGMIALFLVSFVVSLLTTIVIVRRGRRSARRYAQDLPQRFHKGHIPRLGGAGMLVALAAGWLLMAFSGARFNIAVQPAQWVLPLLAIAPAIVCGIGEDLTQRVPVRLRLLLTMASAAALCYVSGVSVSRLDISWLDWGLQAFPWLGVALAIFAIGGLPHAFNIIDGYNGLAGMVAVLISAALVHVALQLGDRALAGMMVCLIGATAGFLLLNYPRGKIFAGDGGAYLWGMVIAFGCVALVSRHPAVSPWFPLLLLSYPVFETLFSIYRKLVRGQSPGMADALHLHQLIYRRMVRVVMEDDNGAREMLHRNNRTSPYLWGVALLTIVPAVLFWNNTWALIASCVVFAGLYVGAYLAIIRFKLPSWIGSDRR